MKVRSESKRSPAGYGPTRQHPGQFGDIRGSLSDTVFSTEGREKLRTSYAAGARLGYLVAPNVLSYVNAGYSGSDWSGTSQTFLFAGPGAITATQATTASFHVTPSALTFKWKLSSPAVPISARPENDV